MGFAASHVDHPGVFVTRGSVFLICVLFGGFRMSGGGRKLIMEGRRGWATD